ncbi:MAG: hypothetical protein U1E45_11780 [Geminicoccaceae bacterium]
MCGLCGLFGTVGHWTDGAGGGLGPAQRQHRVRVANAVLAEMGIRCADWQGRFTLTGPTGRSLVIDHLGALWPAAEKLSGKVLDPLDPRLIARVEAMGGRH